MARYLLSCFGALAMPLGLAFALGATTIPPAAAQSDILDQGKSLIEGLSGGVAGSGLAEEEIAAGLREALRVGAERVVEQVGAPDGFNLDENIQIGFNSFLPDKFLKSSGPEIVLEEQILFRPHRTEDCIHLRAFSQDP